MSLANPEIFLSNQDIHARTMGCKRGFNCNVQEVEKLFIALTIANEHIVAFGLISYCTPINSRTKFCFVFCFYVLFFFVFFFCFHGLTLTIAVFPSTVKVTLGHFLCAFYMFMGELDSNPRPICLPLNHKILMSTGLGENSNVVISC